ncbi:MAG: helix-turn-helix transcriptional regulator [Lachnospiraceae bacterium]|nr:helix-turn-helix transcriptional regulator [Lachnospiraceae bacterium]
MKKKEYVQFSVDNPFQYHMTGKFVAPSESWIHQEAPLDDFELFIVTDDVLYIEHGGTQYTVENGEFLLLPPLTGPDSHRKGFRPSRCSFYWLHFLPANPYTLYQDTPPADTFSKNSICIPLFGQIPNASKLVVQMRQLQNNLQLGYGDVFLNYESTVILCELSGQFAIQEKRDDRSNYQKQLYSEIIDYVKLNTSIILHVSDIAARFGYNEKYISTLFNTFSGMPLKKFISKCKMEDADFLLSETSLSINEISAKLGYTDAHNFARAYKKHTGVSPSAFRESCAKKMIYHI